MTKHHPNLDSFKEVKFISPFVPPELSCEMKHPSSPSFKLKTCPSIQPNKNFYAMDIPSASTLETSEMNSTDKHESFSFETPPDSCSLLESPEFILLKTTCFHEDHNRISILVCKLFKRMVVDAFVYHKYYKSHGCTVKPTLQLELQRSMFGGKAGN